MRRPENLALILLWRELRHALSGVSKSDAVVLTLGGGFLLAYGIADVVTALRAHAAALHQPSVLWTIGLPVTSTALGAAVGLAVANAAIARASAPFLKALPLSLKARRAMACRAVLSIGVLLCVSVAPVIATACVLIAKPRALAWGLAAGAMFAFGFAAMTFRRLSVAFHIGIDPTAEPSRRPSRGFQIPWLSQLDRRGLAWFGAWAWGLRAGRLHPSGRMLSATGVLGLAALLSIDASLARHQAGPAALASVIGGVGVFMLSLRCHPLGAPVLRAAPLSFTRAWARLLRLPMVLSVMFFILPASAALAAQPTVWAMPVGSGLGLLILNGIYAVFAAYFMTAPIVAAASFLAAIAYATYEYLEYGNTVLIGFAALVALLWHRARKRFYHG
jgi:hypothetical protein